MAATTPGADDLRQWIGRVAPDVTGRMITAHDVARYALAIDDRDPIYFSEARAREAGFRAIPAPLGFIYWAAHPWTSLVPLSDLRPDGIPSISDPLVLPITSTRVIRAGDEYWFYDRVYVGDTITVSRSLVDVYRKTGRTGPMVFAKERRVFRTAEGAEVARQVLTRIYR